MPRIPPIPHAADLELELASKEKQFGPDHPDVASLLTDIAVRPLGSSSWHVWLSWARARAERACGLTARRPAHPVPSPPQALHSEEERFATAQPLYERALKVQEKALGPEHADAVQTLTDLAICYLDQGLNEKGKPLLERALGMQEKALGPDHPDVAAIRDVLVSLEAPAA